MDYFLIQLIPMIRVVDTGLFQRLSRSCHSLDIVVPRTWNALPRQSVYNINNFYGSVCSSGLGIVFELTPQWGSKCIVGNRAWLGLQFIRSGE